MAMGAPCGLLFDPAGPYEANYSRQNFPLDSLNEMRATPVTMRQVEDYWSDAAVAASK